MGAKVSQQMEQAVAMVKAGATRYAAAKAHGLTISGITQSKLYREWVAEQAKQKAVAK